MGALRNSLLIGAVAASISLLLAFPSIAQPSEAGQIAIGLQPSIRIEGKKPTLSTLKERMEHYNVPAVSIAFLQHHKFAWTYTEGVIDKVSNVPIDENTVFQAASISKPVFATTLMLYRQAHGLDLDVDVNSLLKSWQLPKHKWQGTSDVTLRRLLSHSAGTTVHGFGGYAAGKTVPSLISVLEGATPANSSAVIVDLEPGTKFRYSGGGTTLAQLVLQDVSGEQLPEMAYKYIFEPLGMNYSAYSQPLTPPLNTNAAVPYNSNGNAIPGGAHTYATLAAAGLWTTPSDLLKLAAAIQLALKGEDQSLLSQATASEMLTKQSSQVGIGFFLAGEEQVSSFSHGGANAGFRTHLFAHTKTGDAVAVMTSGSNGGTLFTEIFNRISEIYDWPENRVASKKIIELTEQQFANLTGKYITTDEEKIEVTLTQEGKTIVLNAGQYIVDEVFLPEGENKFFSMNSQRLTFTQNDEGKVTALDYSGIVKAEKTQD